MTGYDPEEYQEVVERHHRIDSERRKLKQETKETKRIEDEEILTKKKKEKDGKKLSREKRREELAARLKTSDAIEIKIICSDISSSLLQATRIWVSMICGYFNSAVKNRDKCREI